MLFERRIEDAEKYIRSLNNAELIKFYEEVCNYNGHIISDFWTEVKDITTEIVLERMRNA